MLFSFSILLGFVLNLLFVKFNFIRSLQQFLSAKRCPYPMQCFLLCILLPSVFFCVLTWAYVQSKLLWFLVRALLSALVFHTGVSLAAASQIAGVFLSSPEDALSMLSRMKNDSAGSPEPDVLRGTIEFLCMDFVAASALPVLSMLIAGPSFGILCVAACTLDGKQPADMLSRLIRFWPARLGAFFMTVACGLLRYDFNNGRRIYQRDRNFHPDAAAGQILSVCAGSLHIRFTGTNGQTIGNVDRPVVRTDILRVRDLFLFSSWLMLLTGCFIRILFF